MIDILKTEGFNQKDFDQLISEVLKNQNDLEILIPKSTRQFFSSTEDIASDYLTLATVGQILNNASTKFEYKEVAPTLHESVIFTVVPENTEALGKALMESSFFFTDNLENSGDEYDELFLLDAQDEFLEYAKKNTVACPYFHETYLEFYSQINHDE